MKFILFSAMNFCLVLSSLSLAQTQNLKMPVSLTNSNATEYRGPHEAFWNHDVPSSAFLLISLGGTSSLPSDMSAFNKVAVDMGLDAIAIDYDNHIISTSCRGAIDDLCFDKFRHEVVVGENVSELLEVDRQNSIENRIQDFLLHLSKHNPRWKNFLIGPSPDWSKILVVGHSQGSGHAAYLAKRHPLKAVLMLAGPQDRFADGRTVSWLHTKSATPLTRYFSFLHRNDFFGSAFQVEVSKSLMPENAPNILMTEVSVTDPHMSVISPIFTHEWQFLLKKALSP